MGYGDEIVGSGLARGAAVRKKRVAFGDGINIRWHPYAHQIYQGNPNVARPGSEGSADLEWVAHYPGQRVYNSVEQGGSAWRWRECVMVPGEIFSTAEELKFAAKQGQGFVVVEPSVPSFKSVACNKQWPTDRYQEVAYQLMRSDCEVVQLVPPPGNYAPTYRIRGARAVETRTFRDALAVLARAKLYVGPEGGLHHGAAAVGVDAVVIFGGFVPPSSTGYAGHANLTGGAEACGSLQPCSHCREAMDKITVDCVVGAAVEKLAA